MTAQPRSPFDHWFQFNLSVWGYALDTQAQLGQVYLDTLEIALTRGEGRAPRPGLEPPRPRQPIIPEGLPSRIKAHWMLGMLFSGWRLPPATAT